jgi:transposase
VILGVSCGGFKRDFISFYLKNALKITILPDLEMVSKEALYTENVELKGRVSTLEFELSQLKRLVYGQTRERFIPAQVAQQATLFNQEPLTPSVDTTPQVVVMEAVKHKGQKLGEPNPNHNGRNAFPEHLRRETEVLIPLIVINNPLNFTKIGEVVTETLDYTPAKLFVRRRVREKYVFKPTNKKQKAYDPTNDPTNTDNFDQPTNDTVNIAVNTPNLPQNVPTVPTVTVPTVTVPTVTVPTVTVLTVTVPTVTVPTVTVPTVTVPTVTVPTVTVPTVTVLTVTVPTVPTVPTVALQAEDWEGVFIAPLPERALPKSIAESGLLAQVLVDKFVDHLPIDRQAKRWKRESGIDIKGSTVVGWIDGTCDLLMPLYDKLTELVFDCRYLQADESTLKSLENAPKGNTHTSYQWVYRNTEKNLILFDYQRHRADECLHPSVKKHQGCLQTDGYKVYDALKGLPNLTLANCLAHARRKFFDATQNDPKRAESALTFIQQLYKIEKYAQDEKMSKVEITQLRQEKCPPILKKFKEWLQTEQLKTIPKSPIGKAIDYTLNRWEKLTIYITDGHIAIDNNLIENAIRPLALGRKNYLFVGSDEGGKRTAMMYSFFATCKAHNVNPLEWLTDVLNKIPNYTINKIHELLPHLWKKG